MPKITKRNRQYQRDAVGHPTTTIMTQARKVSFEEGSESSSTSTLNKASDTQHSSSCQILPRTNQCVNMEMKNKLLLRKLTPCICLSDMAPKEEDHRDYDLSSPVSTSNSHVTDETSSPWGQFVDVIFDDHDEFSTPSRYVESFSSSPRATYHPYMRPSRNGFRKTKTCLNGFLLAIPSEEHGLKRKPSTMDVQRVLQQLRM